MKSNKALPFIISVALVNLSACSTIKSLFPDKEKDYQFTTEIQPLVLPPDLKGNTIFKTADASSAVTFGAEKSDVSSPKEKLESPDQVAEKAIQEAEEPVVEETPAQSDTTASEVPSQEPGSEVFEQARAEPESAAAEQQAQEPETSGDAPAVEQPVQNQAEKSDAIPVELVVYDDGESRLRIATDTSMAWHLVGKALSRQSIEVIARSQEDRSFSVQYDPNEKPVEDGTLWDEAVFLFRGFQTNEKEYMLKLIENQQQSEVAVLDEEGKPASNGAALRLLKLIQNTLKSD